MVFPPMKLGLQNIALLHRLFLRRWDTTRQNRATIKSVVFDAIHRTQGTIQYPELEKEVLERFRQSAFQKSHWAWYRYQCTKGKYASQFNRMEKWNLSKPAKVKLSKESKMPLTASEPQTVPVTEEVLSGINKAIKGAIAYENAIGGVRKTGITAEVGEILACYHLKLRLCVDPRAQGYDAVDQNGRRVQIKTRRSESEGLPRDAGRIGTFSNHVFDYVVLVLLDHEYRLAEMWRANYRDIWPLVAKQKRRNPNLSTFKKAAERIWPKR